MSKTLEITNATKKGNIKVIKYEKGNHGIKLKDVEFKLYKDGSTLIGTYKTDVNGEININNLDIGNYKLVEIKTNAAYDLTNDVNFTVNYNQTTTIEIDNELSKGQLKVIKVDEENKNIPIKDVEFQVLDENKKLIETIKTDSQGIATTSRLPSYNKKYYLKEIKTNSIYVLDSTLHEFTLTKDNIKTLEITNARKKGNIKIIKRDKDNHDIKLKDVEFKLYKDNVLVGTYKTDSNGVILINNLDIGNYKLVEIKTNAAYDLTNDVNLVVNYNQTTTLEIDNELSKGQVQVIKIDSDHNEIPIEGVEFQILDKNKNYIETIKTNSQGIAITSKLPSYNQTYYLKEVKTNNNYILDSSLKEFTVVKDKITPVILENKHKEGNIQVYKVDKDNNKITMGGITFELYSEEFDKLIGVYKTDLNGEIYVNGLRTGNYIWKEITKKNGYYLAKDTRVEVKYNETTQVIIENELEKGQIKVIKVDKDDNTIVIPDTKFEILDENKHYIETITTDSNGIAISSRLPSYNRIYYVREIEANKYYQLNDTEFKIGLVVDKTKELTIENEVKKGQIQILKVDKDDKNIKIEGVKFNIINERTKEVVDSIVTDKNGLAITKPLSIWDTYTAFEVETNKKYELNTENIVGIRIPDNDTIQIQVTNEKKKGQVKIIKVDADNHKVFLENVVFDILDKDMNYIETIITNRKGEATSSLLPCVDEVYYLKEKSTNELYKLSDEFQTITLNENQILNIVFENYAKTGNLKIIKVDKDNNAIPVENAKFEVIDETDNKVIDTIVSNEQGIAELKDLKVTRRYTIHEISTNKKYNINKENIINVIIKADDTINVKIENEKKKGQVRIIKIDKDDNEVLLEGVKFEILDSNMNIVEELETNESGEAISSMLPCVDETYIIREKETLQEYVLNEEIKTITLEENQIKDITFENEKIKGYLQVIKFDSKDNDIKLKDAEFGIYNENHELVQTIKTNEEGIAISDLLVIGKYYVKELSTGTPYYLLNENTYEFEIVKNHETIEIKIDNESVDIEVDVDKEGDIEVKPGEIVHYNFSNIANKSNTYLESFKWYDYIPTDSTRIVKMTTGTWNQDLDYSIYYKTNKSEDYILYKENFNTKENYEIDFTNIELTEDEYIIEFCLDFGKVDIGFKEETSPTLECKALDTLEDNFTFVNHTKTIGNYYGIQVESDSDWPTIVHTPEEPEIELPRTGK